MKVYIGFILYEDISKMISSDTIGRLDTIERIRSKYVLSDANVASDDDTLCYGIDFSSIRKEPEHQAWFNDFQANKGLYHAMFGV